MAVLPYEAPTSTTEPTVDIILFSNDGDNAFFDPWGNVEMLRLN